MEDEVCEKCREEIVSSLITLSETLCEKAIELHESESAQFYKHKLYIYLFNLFFSFFFFLNYNKLLYNIHNNNNNNKLNEID